MAIISFIFIWLATIYLSSIEAKTLEFVPFARIAPARSVPKVSGSQQPFAPPRPVWGDMYSVSGAIQLPYAELNEPFSAWYDARVSDKGKSRIDYYNGVDRTIQRGDLGSGGVAYIINPTTFDKQQILNQMTCFQLNGSQEIPVEAPQATLPDTSNLEYAGTELMEGRICQIWRNITWNGDKKNIYTLWVTDDDGQLPVKYEMSGYDTILHSHYDKYVIIYYEFNNHAELDSSVFEVPSDIKACQAFPGPGSSHSHKVLEGTNGQGAWRDEPMGLLEHRVTMNPFSEFISNVDAHHHEMFARFKDKHAPIYESPSHESERFAVFKANVRYILSHNRRFVSFRMAINRFADRTREEIRALLGLRVSGAEQRRRSPISKPFPYGSGASRRVLKSLVKDLPPSFDWRLFGAVTPVKDQAICGSCWSFGTTGVIEGAYFLKNKKLVRFSQQQLVDCSWAEGNNGCDGGEDFRAVQWIAANGGLAAEDDYEYLGQNGYCNLNVSRPVQLASITQVDSNVDALKIALTQYGPLSIGIDASHTSLAFYSNGVYFEPNCGNRPDDLDHAVLAVGYGQLDGQDYWLVKNSWSTHWGNDGYVLMSQKDNNCGVLTSASYVTLA